MTTTGSPIIYTEHADLDALTEMPAAMIAARDLKPGHVLLDPEMHTPLYSVDHRNRPARNSGNVALFVFDYETNSYHEVSIFGRAMVPVAAR